MDHYTVDRHRVRDRIVTRHRMHCLVLLSFLETVMTLRNASQLSMHSELHVLSLSLEGDLVVWT